MKQSFFILILLLITSACTVQKRLHTKGWNIQWRNNQRVQREQPSEATNVHFQDKTQSEVMHLSDLEAPELTPASIENPVHKETSSLSTDYSDNYPSHSSWIAPDDTSKKVLTTNPNLKESEDGPNQNYRKNVDSEFGLRMLLYGAICFLLAGLCYLAAIQSGTLAGLLYFFGAAAFGALGVILLLVALIAILVAFAG